jgi:hypothetical protein
LDPFDVENETFATLAVAWASTLGVRIVVVPARALLKSVLVWAAILVLAILNGLLRDMVLVHALGPTSARLVSGIVLCAVIVAAAAQAAPWHGKLAPRSFWLIGALWLVLTLLFETAVGYAQHRSWQRLLDAYTLQDGNLWPLILVTTLIAPWLGARIRGIRQNQ